MKRTVVLVVLGAAILGLLLMVAIMLWPLNHLTPENEELQAKIEQMSGRAVSIGTPVQMYRQAIRLGDSESFVLSLLKDADKRVMRRADGELVEIEVRFDGTVTQDFLAVQFDETGLVDYVGIQ
jgi:hypothetical protein